MTAIVTLHVFSGLPNPTWQLDESQDAEFTERMHSLADVTERRPRGAYGGLGYRGFTITRRRSTPRARSMCLCTTASWIRA